MNGIMHSSVHKISEYKPREEHCHVPPRQEIHDRKNCGRKYEAGNRWHKESFAIPWIFVMIAMQDVNEFFCPFVFGHEMKNEAMHDVFKQGPEKHAT